MRDLMQPPADAARVRAGGFASVGASRDRASDEASEPATHPHTAVLAAFLERVDAAAKPAYAAIRQLPGYCDLDEAGALHVLRSVRWVFVTLIDCLRKDRQLTGREVARLHDIGVARARSGIPSGAFHLAFSVGVGHAIAGLRAVARDLGHDVAGTIERDLMWPLADAVNVRRDGFAKVAGSFDLPEGVRRDEAGVPLGPGQASQLPTVAELPRTHLGKVERPPL